MKLDKHIVKGALEVYLQKEGYTIQDLEDYLRNGGVEKHADEPKKDGTKSKGLGNYLSGFTGVLGGAGKMIGGVTGLIGGVAGLGAYGAYKELKDSDNKIDKNQETIRKIESATRELQATKAQHQMGYSGL